MKPIKLIIPLLIITLLSCEDNINGPVGSDLIYEQQELTIGNEVEFGTINEDVIKIKLTGLDKESYLLEHSNKICESCPLYADEMWLELIMCNDKYKVAFLYNSKKDDKVTLQLYKYERL